MGPTGRGSRRWRSLRGDAKRSGKKREPLRTSRHHAAEARHTTSRTRATRIDCCTSSTRMQHSSSDLRRDSRSFRQKKRRTRAKHGPLCTPRCSRRHHACSVAVHKTWTLRDRRRPSAHRSMSWQRSQSPRRTRACRPYRGCRHCRRQRPRGSSPAQVRSTLKPSVRPCRVSLRLCLT
jgi:hypothetical protein